MLRPQLSHYGSAFLLLCLLAELSGKTHGQKVRPWRERLLAEATQQWQAYRSFVQRLQGTRDVEVYQLNGTERTLHDSRRIEYRQQGTWTLCVFHEKGPRPLTPRAQVVNSRYAFELKKTTQDKPWVLTTLNLNLQQSQPLVTARKEFITTDLSTLLFVDARVLPAMMKEPTFRIVDARSTQQEGRELLHVEFSNRRDIRHNEPGSIAGRMLLDPEHYWVIKECEYEGTYAGGVSGKIRFANNYTPNENGYPIPVKHTRREVYSVPEGGERVWETLQSFRFYEQDQVPEQEFSLTAFGLREPKGAAIPQSSHAYLWFIASAVGLLGVAFYCWRRVHRRTLIG